MEIGTILSKLLKGEQLTDEEKDFAEKFDFAATLDKNAANARRKAEADSAKHLAEITRLKTELDEAKKTAQTKTEEDATEIGKLMKAVEKLQTSYAAMEKKANEAEAENKRVKRLADIDEFAKANGVHPAKGVSEKLFHRFLHESIGDTDVADADAMKSAIDAFKKENAALILNEGVAAPGSGRAAETGFTGKNPFAKDTQNATEQFELYKSNPALAKQLAAEAGVSLE